MKACEKRSRHEYFTDLSEIIRNILVFTYALGFIKRKSAFLQQGNQGYFETGGSCLEKTTVDVADRHINKGDRR